MLVICVCIHTYMYICINAYMHAYIHTYIHACMQAYSDELDNLLADNYLMQQLLLPCLRVRLL